ncbi:MAG: hypothetical protein H6581_16105 [Bacteroidia bacterium]|nr:hypothetical protein [Bacteroidia bacterium]
MADAGGFKTWFKEKAWPWIKLIPYALLTGICTGWIYCFYVSGECKTYIYMTGLFIAFVGFYFVILFSRMIKNTEFVPEEEEFIDEG